MTREERENALHCLRVMVSEEVCEVDCVRAAIEALKKEPKTGHWIDIKNKNGTVIAVRCSRCGNSPKHAIKSDFCPNCGADMREVSE